ncbi:APC family permease [Pseudactinotalea sp. HY158]|uniref:APC family permease n=1 Tax=unclassified Pseudactinotalea TaxID=2649176 RepID=UPI00129C1786|nr:APC family permease [Pseudactinotalea sp. HY158]MPV49410.1 amino acid permease [Pseudactinotalea sp. HY160]QGH69298.1 amino acid permease [Pseudactinotalea sp. HY158]
MPNIGDAAKRLLVGRPMRSDRLGHTLLPKRLALPVFASDALSSVAYAPDEILLTLSLAGLTAYAVSPWVGIAVVVVMLTVVTSYRQTVRAYPSGGGAYEVTATNLGKGAGLTVASALLVDYVLTVAVSISSGTQYLATVLPAAGGHETGIAIGIVLLLALLNLRGVRESGAKTAIPVYVFMLSMGVLAVAGAVQWLAGSLGRAPSADLALVSEPGFDQGLMGLAGGLLILRAFSSGSAALTGVEAIANGVPNFRKPKSRNAGTTLLLLGGLGSAMLLTVLLLAGATGVRFVEDPASQLLRDGVGVGADYVQNPVIGQLASTVFAGFQPMFYLLTISTGIILLLAANTAYNGFPILGSILAREGYLPRQLHTRGDRLAYSNGIVVLSLAAAALIWIFDAQVTRLIQLYIVGVFVSFTLCQLGMVKHWGGVLRTSVDPGERRRVRTSRALNAFGFALTGIVLVVVLITKATHGAWITLVLMGVLFALMTRISRHYADVREDLTVTDYDAERALPSRVHAVVLVSQVHKPTMRALAYARATRPSTLQALTVAVEPGDAESIRAAWDAAGVPLPLTVVDSPYREIVRPVLDFVRNIRRESPRDLVVVYIPEYVVDHWWAQVLHNQNALRLKSRLLFTRGVVVASVPWQLGAAAPRQPRD